MFDTRPYTITGLTGLCVGSILGLHHWSMCERHMLYIRGIVLNLGPSDKPPNCVVIMVHIDNVN